jgi:hypothetical protein
LVKCFHCALFPPWLAGHSYLQNVKSENGDARRGWSSGSFSGGCTGSPGGGYVDAAFGRTLRGLHIAAQLPAYPCQGLSLDAASPSGDAGALCLWYSLVAPTHRLKTDLSSIPGGISKA